ncbi:MAG: hypothetical protein IJV27_04260 [Prevotella sp.]|nr:hypothetical protein [Prevotella sp.]
MKKYMQPRVKSLVVDPENLMDMGFSNTQGSGTGLSKSLDFIDTSEDKLPHSKSVWDD